MKLKQHRDDVRYLNLMQDNYVQAIAERYRRLIMAVEYGLTINKLTLKEIDEFGGPDLKQVLKDAEVK